MLDPGPDARHDVVRVPDDAATVARVGQKELLPAPDVDHGALPALGGAGFGGGDESAAFVGREDVVEDDGVETFVHGQVDLFEVDAGDFDVLGWGLEEVLRQKGRFRRRGSHGRWSYVKLRRACGSEEMERVKQ